MIFIGIDDTDNREGGGTGSVARAIASVLRETWSVIGVSRHQLLVDPRVPYTSNNSCNVIHLELPEGARPELPALQARVRDLLVPRCLPGSDPGLCVGTQELVGHPFGSAVQERLATQEEAFRTARELGALLQPLGGTGDGVIGALAGVILAAGGNDGRFVDVGAARELEGTVPVAQVLAAGVARVRTREGLTVLQGRIDTRGGRVRPILEQGDPVLLVEPAAADLWQVVELGKPHRKNTERHRRDEKARG